MLLAATGCADEGPGGHREESEILDSIEFADVDSVVSTENHRDEVERVIDVDTAFDPERSITPPDGWSFVEAYDQDWSGPVERVYVFDGPGPSDEFSDCSFTVVTKPNDTRVEVHVNCVRTA